MIQTNKLKEIITKEGKSQKEVAAAVGVPEKTFCQKMKKGTFGSDEMQKLTNYLHITNPGELFFA